MFSAIPSPKRGENGGFILSVEPRTSKDVVKDVFFLLDNPEPLL
jgi:hypothetical protein